jgi:ethanolaminephosphotransferase
MQYNTNETVLHAILGMAGGDATTVIGPESLTLTGFLVQFVPFIVSCIASDWLTQPVPRWVTMVNVLGCFIYHVLDALDGKQARRTKSGSVLGHLFDHGCDALTTVFELVKLAASLNAGVGYGTYILVFASSVGFYVAAYQEYVTDRLWLAVMKRDG